MPSLHDPGGNLRYTILDDTTRGTMAERTVIELDRSVVLPGHQRPRGRGRGDEPRHVLVGGVAPANRLWGSAAVAILGATGNAGRLAVQVAKRFGTSRVIAVGRDTTRRQELMSLGADEVCTFDQLALAADVDVVIDYVWGEPTAAAMTEIITNRADRGRPLTWLEIGAIAGPEAAIPAAALRVARLQIVGSGIGSVAGRDFVKEIPMLAEAVAQGAFDIRATAVPLAAVEQAWAGVAGTADRVVLAPDRTRTGVRSGLRVYVYALSIHSI